MALIAAGLMSSPKIAAREFLRQGRLVDNTLVATVMSNYGLEESLGECGGKVIRANVGDRGTWRDVQDVHHAVDLQLLVAAGLLKDRQVARIGRAGRPLRRLRAQERCSEKTEQPHTTHKFNAVFDANLPRRATLYNQTRCSSSYIINPKTFAAARSTCRTAQCRRRCSCRWARRRR